MSAAIEAIQLDKFFGSAVVMRRLGLEVAPGEGLLVYGRNGAGKSTLVRLLAGLGAPSGGDARVFGTSSRNLSAAQRRRIALLSHQSFLYANLTARENLTYFGRLYGLAQPSEAAALWLERVGLGASADERVGRFSRGMEQRLALARVMLPAPEVLLMDEPLAGLDVEGARLTEQVLKEALENGGALVATAHSAEQLPGLPLARAELRGGRLDAWCAPT